MPSAIIVIRALMFNSVLRVTAQVWVLFVKELSTIVADDILFFFINILQKKVRRGFSYESYDEQTIHMKYQAILSLTTTTTNKQQNTRKQQNSRLLQLWKAPYISKIDMLFSKKGLINWYMVLMQS